MRAGSRLRFPISCGEYGIREPRGIALEAAIDGVLCTLRTSQMAPALAIRSGAVAPIAPAP